MLNDALLFVAIVQAGSFTKAAKNLKSSKSQLSRHMHRLEEELGLTLLKRTTRTLALTDAGRDFYHYCQNIQLIYEQALNKLEEHKHALKGNVTISAPISIGRVLLTPKIITFMDNYPDITINSILTDKPLDLIENNIDIALRLSNQLPDSTLIAKKIGQIQYCLCASNDYLNKNPKLNTPLDLNKHRLIGSSAFSKIKWHFENELTISAMPHATVNDYSTQIDMALHHIGIINVPEFLIKDLQQRAKLNVILSHYQITPGTLWAVFSKDRQMPVRVRRFLDFLNQINLS
jgi:DNA-binding transcriptional LysR family regulator